MKLEAPCDLVLPSYIAFVFANTLMFLKLIFSHRSMTRKAEQIPFFLTPRTENKTKQRKMYERQRAITSLSEVL